MGLAGLMQLRPLDPALEPGSQPERTGPGIGGNRSALLRTRLQPKHRADPAGMEATAPALPAEDLVLGAGEEAGGSVFEFLLRVPMKSL